MNLQNIKRLVSNEAGEWKELTRSEMIELIADDRGIDDATDFIDYDLDPAEACGGEFICSVCGHVTFAKHKSCPCCLSVMLNHDEV